MIADPVSLDDRLEALEALRVLADLPDRQRRDLALLVASFTYSRPGLHRARARLQRYAQ